MIRITMAGGFVALTVFALAVLGILWLYDLWREQVREWQLSEERLGQCGECNLTFLVPRHETVVRCPRCRALCSLPRR